MPGIVHFYGERGLVDSLVLDLKVAGKLGELLNEIVFPYRAPDRLRIAADAEVVVIIEAGFGGNTAGFGWPDVVLAVTLPSGVRAVCFLEAKAGLYEKEAANFTARGKGFNSKINGQLTLRFRLARALSAYAAGDRRVVEPDGMARAYGEEGRPRRLAKIDNLRNIVEPYLIPKGGEQEVEYLFAALTDDHDNVWCRLADDSVILPFLLNPLSAGEDAPDEIWARARNAWVQHRQGFGWIGFEAVERLVADGPLFAKARHFLDAKRAARRRTRATATAGVSNIRPTAWSKYAADSPTVRLRDRIRSIVQAAVQGTDLCYDIQTGSDSVIGTDGRRLVKLLPPIPGTFPDAAVCLCVNTVCTGLPESVLNGRVSHVIAINSEEFETVELRDPDMPDRDLTDLIRDILAGAAVADESEM